MLSAGYLFLDRCYVLVDGDPMEEIVIELRPKDASSDLLTLGRELNNELINYANYQIQALKNAKIREAILQRVLGKSGNKAMQDNERSAEPRAPWVEENEQDNN